MEKTIYLSEHCIELIHHQVIMRYGGKKGIRNLDLLQSALAQPQVTFGGKLLHQSIHQQAAAYFFHLCQNHPFIDGNKRVGLVSALVFLKNNRRSIDFSPEKLELLTWDVAAGRVNKEEITAFLSSPLEN